MTHNQKQQYMAVMFRVASNDSFDLDLRYAVAREMQRRRSEPTTLSREMLFRIQRAYRKAVLR